MIAKLTGIIDSLADNGAVIDVGGVGYLVFCSARSLARLAKGETVSLLVETHVREDHIHLFGFLDAGERDWFRLLVTVQGVGARVALAILSVLDGTELVQAIAASDKAAITRAPGVGPKLAARILNELKDKVGDVALGPGAAMGEGGGDMANALSAATADAISALVNLGYNPSRALTAVQSAAAGLGAGANVETLIRGGLAELGSAEMR
jgi:Holliday junction DNA helicase RuvA